MARKSRGRQKVPMVKMQNESNLQVTFSKRRSGLFKKANELCVLCAAEVAIIVFSPGQKVYSFGHPGVEPIVDRYLDRHPPSSNGTDRIVEAHRNANIRHLNLELTHIENMLEAEKRLGESLDRMRKAGDQHWWQAPVEDLTVQQLDQLMKALEALKKCADDEVSKFVIQAANINPYILQTSIFGSGIAPSNAEDAIAAGFGGVSPFDYRASGFNRGIASAARESDPSAVAHLNPRASGCTSSDMPHEFSNGYGRRFL